MPDYNVLPDECDWLCEYRWCLHKTENKGSFVAGRGYTSYYDKPYYVCGNRAYHGCPDGPVDGRPEPDWIKVKEALFGKVDSMRKTMQVSLAISKIERLVDALIQTHIKALQ